MKFFATVIRMLLPLTILTVQLSLQACNLRENGGVYTGVGDDGADPKLPVGSLYAQLLAQQTVLGQSEDLEVRCLTQDTGYNRIDVRKVSASAYSIRAFQLEKGNYKLVTSFDHVRRQLMTGRGFDADTELYDVAWESGKPYIKLYVTPDTERVGLNDYFLGSTSVSLDQTNQIQDFELHCASFAKKD